MIDCGISFGKVVNTADPSNAGRVQVRIPGVDSRSSDEELPWAFPLLPKMVHICPKTGETVMIINRVFENERSDRLFIGPVISQPQFMYSETDENSALRMLNGTRIGAEENVEDHADVRGSLPGREDVAILGRKDTDVILRDDDIMIRCGVKKTNERDKTEFSFNSKHPAFIKMKHYPEDERKGKNYESVLTLVADKINLIGGDSNDRFKFSDPDALISDDEVDRFIKEAHQLPFGDRLIEFLRVFITAFQSHTHPWVGRGMTPCKDITYKALLDYNLESILSTTARIN